MFPYLYFLSLLLSTMTIWWSKRIYNTYINHYLLFDLWWLGTILLTYKSPNYPEIHDITYIILLGGLCIFNITILIYKPIKLNYPFQRKEYFFNIKHRRLLELFVLICYFPAIKNNIISLANGDAFWLIRQEYFEENRSYFQDAINLYICQPISMFLFVTAYYKYYTNIGKHSYTLNIIVSILIVICACFTTGGRTSLINFIALYLIICLCYKFKYYYEVLNNNAKFNIKLLAIPVAAIIFLTASRNLINDNVSLIDLLRFSYGLYGGLFDYYLCGGGNIYLNEPSYGLSTFEGIYLFINYPFKIIFGTNILEYTPVDDIIQDPVFLINSEYPVNAHVSMYFRFVRDWGIIGGLFIGPMLMSILYHTVFYIASKKQVHLILYFVLLMQINYTTFDNLFCKNVFIVFLIWYFIFIKFGTIKKYVSLNSYPNL